MLKSLFIGSLLSTLATFIMIMMAVVGLWRIYKIVQKKGPKALKAQRTSSLFPSYISKSMDMQAMMVAKYVSLQENIDYWRRYDSSSHALDYLLEKLDFDRDNGPFKIVAANQICDISEHRCNTLYELTVAFGDHEGQTVYMTIENWRNNTHYHVKSLDVDRERYQFVNNKEPLSDYYFLEDFDGDTQVRVGSSIHLLIPNTMPADCDPVVSLKKILQDAKVIQKDYPDEDESKSFTRMYYLHDNGEEITLRPKTIVGKALSNAQIDALYAPFEIEYHKEKFKIKASSMVKLMATQLYHGGNVFLNGVMGTGKTSFMQLVMNHLSNMEDTIIVNVMPSLIRGLKELRAQTQFTDALGSIILREANTRVIVFLDEGESMMAKSESKTHSEDNTFVASLLDGEIKKIIQCGTAITFNAKQEDLNPILFRSGRAQMVSEVKPIVKSEASAAVRAMKMVNVDKVFDERKFNSLVDSVNTTADGKTYCPAGYITLADISGCFLEKDVDSMILEAIRGESLSFQPEIKKGQKNPPPPPPAVKKLPAVPPAGNAITQSINEKMREMKKLPEQQN